MLTVNSISKSYGLEQVLKEVSFTLNPGDRLGLVGPNGCGKTTLLRILAGLERPDAGSFHYNPPILPIGYLPQGLEIDPYETIGSYLEAGRSHLGVLAEEVERLAVELEHFPQNPAIQEQYDRAVRRYEEEVRQGGGVSAILSGFSLHHYSLDTPVESISGGQKTRLALARILSSHPQLLLLDEPTNHLDLDMLAWLEDWITNRSGDRRTCALIVSHDRAFLDATVNGILELDLFSHTLRPYAGDFSDYVAARQKEVERQWQAYHDQQEELDRLQEASLHLRDIARFRKGGKADGGDKFARGFFSDRSKSTVGRSKNLEKRRERLLHDNKVDKPKPTWQMALTFQGTPESSRQVLVMENLTVGYPGRVLAENINQVLHQGERLALVGPNGSGKTTILRVVVGEISPIGGRVRTGPSVKTGYMAQDQETLDPGLNPFHRQF